MIFQWPKRIPISMVEGPRVLQVKAIVITGKGPMFCGGAEITELLGRRGLQEDNTTGISGKNVENVHFAISFPSKDVALTIKIHQTMGFFAAKIGLNMFEQVLTKKTCRLNWWGNTFSRRRTNNIWVDQAVMVQSNPPNKMVASSFPEMRICGSRPISRNGSF